MAVRTGRLLCAARRRTRIPPELAKLTQLDYARHVPDAYIEKTKGTTPHQILEDRFGAPPIKRYFQGVDRSEKNYVQTDYRPFEREAVQENRQVTFRRTQKPSKPVHSDNYPQNIQRIPDEEWMFFRGDKVQVMVGPDTGRIGIITYVAKHRNKVLVGAMHMKDEIETDPRERRLKQLLYDRERFAEEQFLDVSKGEVQLIDTVSLEPTEAEWCLTPDPDHQGKEKAIRVSTTSGSEIPIPAEAYATYEYTTAQNYVECIAKDTTSDVALDETYNHELGMFENSCENSLGLEPTTLPFMRSKTYWY